MQKSVDEDRGNNKCAKQIADVEKNEQGTRAELALKQHLKSSKFRTCEDLKEEPVRCTVRCKQSPSIVSKGSRVFKVHDDNDNDNVIIASCHLPNKKECRKAEEKRRSIDLMNSFT